MLNIKWYVGQPIVCIQTHSRGFVKKNQEFTIKSIQQCRCGSIDLNIGIPIPKSIIIVCNCGETEKKILWLSEILFAPLDVNISELTEILTKEFQDK
jgi:hypothetical protein